MGRTVRKDPQLKVRWHCRFTVNPTMVKAAADWGDRAKVAYGLWFVVLALFCWAEFVSFRCTS